ncbi:C-terminal binding protein [Variovorax sp. PDC80]|uniref:C-terminal binding protein n=1 Tax=Variovorax sp. PDC80 TaxID=1882827 RepID=UPI00210992F8|nr:C-terminal binding protein [Variovorax sp. PDC80]
MTDFAWPDTHIEAQIIGAAGFELVCGPASPVAAEEIARLARGHQPAAILTCWAQVNAQAIAAAQDLRIVARLGVGLDNIDVAEASRRGILVTNVPDYCVEEVSDHALALVLAWSRGIARHGLEVRQGHWEPGSARLKRLSELTVGIVGFGRIGRRTAEKLRPWGCPLLVNDPGKVKDPHVRQVDLNELLSSSDVVIIHAPLTPETRALFNAARFALMRPGALVVNVSRGPIVDTGALVHALASGHLGGAALDVLDTEPVVPQALAELPTALLTPHIAFSSDASLVELRRRACEEVVRVLNGQPPHHPMNQPQNSAKP